MYRLAHVKLDLQEIRSSNVEKFHHHLHANRKIHAYHRHVVQTVNAEMLTIKECVLVYLILMEYHQTADRNV